jgi:hypothetical protein
MRRIDITPSATVPAEWESVDGVMLDVLMQSHDRYGVNGSACYLLRPDTVVAARATRRVGPGESAPLINIYTGLT